MNKKIILFFFATAFILAGCLRFQSQTETPTLTFTALPTQTPEPAAETSLTVCLGREPNTLYPFGELNSAAQSVLAAIYDGPFDTLGYEYQPVILTQMPSLENGDAQIVSITVQDESLVVDAEGNLVQLEAGTQVRPSGCRRDDCVVTFDGTGSLEMDQMVVTFRMRPNLTWSDGTPLTADDSVFAFEILQNADEYLIERTQAYEAADAQTLQWWGIPGFIDPTYSTNFWSPAPKHLWGEFTSEELPSVDIAARSPVGWGAYQIEEWIPGDHITLTKNPYYYLNESGYPATDIVNIRFIPDPDTALTELIAARCDILDPSINLDSHLGLLLEMQAAEQAQVFVAGGTTVEWLGLGLAPASYDDGYDQSKDRQNFFADKHTRAAIAYCLDRQAIVDNVLFGMTTVPAGYVPAEHPAFDPNLPQISYDPETGRSFLELAGWRDADDDPATPMRAVNVRNVAYNTPLQLDYYTTGSTQRKQIVEIIEKSLAECGIGLNVIYLSSNELYTGGPNGVLFGRNFDLAEYAMGVEGIEPPCNWFASDGIPTEDNSWAGTNITGFSSEAYDEACREAQSSLRDEQTYIATHRQAQVILSDELPAIPLFHRLKIAVARPDVCHFDLDPSANSLWNIESIGKGETCQK